MPHSVKVGFIEGGEEIFVRRNIKNYLSEIKQGLENRISCLCFLETSASFESKIIPTDDS